MSWRGGEQQIAYLIEGLRSMNVSSHLFTAEGSKMEEYALQKDWNVISYDKAGAIDPWAAHLIAKSCGEQNIDLIHAHDSHAHTYACIAHTFMGCKPPIVLARRIPIPIQNNIFSRWKYNHSAVRRIICVSRFIAEKLKKDIDPPDRLRVVHSSCRPERFDRSPRGELLRKEFHIPHDHWIVGNTSALTTDKDYRTFIDTAEILLKRNFKAYFLIIGSDAGAKEELEEYVREKSLTHRIHFVGFRKEIEKLLPELNVFLMPSRVEGLGSSVLDAFAAEVPVVATRAGGIPEMVTHGENGLLADIGESETLARYIEQLRQHPPLRARIIEEGKNTLNAFSTEQMVRKTKTVYTELLDAASPRKE